MRKKKFLSYLGPILYIQWLTYIEADTRNPVDQLIFGI